MHRKALTYLTESWLSLEDRKPLIIRGARQVGKTWLVRQLASTTGKKLIETNFERNPQLATLFMPNDPEQILLNLSVSLNHKINPENSLLFLDEIQAAPEILAKLRWFAEDLPQLAVIGAGSLLEFVLEDHAFSMPVGRISYLHLEPLSFDEFLLARGQNLLYDYLCSYRFGIDIPHAIHAQCLSLLKEYVVVGGMPAVVQSWIAEQALPRVSQIQHDLLATYRDDFAKYRGTIPMEKLGALDEVLMSIPKKLGQKFVYSKINPEIDGQMVKKILSLFNKARICHRVSGCSANGVPLASELKEKYFKEIFLDTGLCSAALGMNYNQIQSVTELVLINNGALAEQIVGQLLRTINPFYVEPFLYYWHRDAQGSSAEIDYVIQHGNSVIPIEVKAGTTGTLKSLHLFMESKNGDLAVRINSDIPSKTEVTIKGRGGATIPYTLLSLPFYLVGQIPRLLDEERKSAWA